MCLNFDLILLPVFISIYLLTSKNLYNKKSLKLNRQIPSIHIQIDVFINHCEIINIVKMNS